MGCTVLVAVTSIKRLYNNVMIGKQGFQTHTKKIHGLKWEALSQRDHIIRAKKHNHSPSLMQITFRYWKYTPPKTKMTGRQIHMFSIRNTSSFTVDLPASYLLLPGYQSKKVCRLLSNPLGFSPLGFHDKHIYKHNSNILSKLLNGCFITHHFVKNPKLQAVPLGCIPHLPTHFRTLKSLVENR